MAVEVIGNPEDPTFRRVIGLDLSVRATGLCAMDKAGTIHFARCEGSSLERTATYREKLDRIHYIAKMVIEGIRHNTFLVTEPGARCKKPWEFRPYVAIEGYAYSKGGSKGKGKDKEKSGSSGAGAAFDLGELGGVIKSQIFLTFGIEAYIVAPGTARKFVVGKGRPTKAEVVAYANANGLPTKNHNIADAWVIAQWLRGTVFEEQGNKNDEAKNVG